MPELSNTFRQASRGFNTQGTEAAYNAQMGMNFAQGQSTTSTMARAAENRAQRTGGQVAASFAAGSAMLPYHQQNQSMLGDLEDYKLRAATSRLQMMGGLAGQMAGLRQGQQGQLADYYNQGANREQQGNQFNLSLGEQQRQFAAQQALRTRGQDFAERQYHDQLSLQRSSGGYGGGGSRGGGGNLPTQGNVAAIMAAHNSDNPSALAYWQRYGQATNQSGYQDAPVFGTGY